MKNSQTLCILTSAALLLCGCAARQSAEIQRPASTAFTIDELLGRMPARDSLEARWVFLSLASMGQPGVQEICARIDQPGTPATAQGEYALQGLATYLSDPDRETERRTFVSALGRELEKPLPVEKASFVLRLLQVAGRAEAVPFLSKFLADERLCEPAVQSLVAIGTNAAQSLRAALPGAVGNNRITLINALGKLRAAEAVDLLLQEAGSQDAEVRTAACAALANIGDSRADRVLAEAASDESAQNRSGATWNYLLFARRQNQAGNRANALRIAREILDKRRSGNENSVRAAALSLLVESEGSNAIDELLAETRESDKSLRVAAFTLASQISGEQVTAKWTAAMKTASPEVRGEIIDMLAKRGDKSAYPSIAEAVSDPDSGVRQSAIDAAVRLKGAGSLPTLLTHLEQSRDPGDIAAVKRSCALLPASRVIPPAVDALPRLTPPACAVVIDVLAGYGTQVPAAPLLALCRSEHSMVRLAALKALGSVGAKEDQAQLIALLLSAKTETEQSAAQKSLVSVCSRLPDPEARAELIFTAMETAPHEQRGLLLRTLGRIGGTRAMALIMQETRSSDAGLREAAVRALADWPDLKAFGPLLAISGSKEKQNLRVLALRGCVRVVENASLNAETAVRYHEQTLVTAERPEEKRLVLGALSNLHSANALRVVLPYLADETVGVDAAAAAGKIVSETTENKDNTRATELTRVFVESRVSPRIRAQVAAAFDAAVRRNDPPEGFKALFNGKDLEGWKGLVGNPLVRASMDPKHLAAEQARADSSMRTHWSVVDGILVFDGKGESLCSAKEYEDFELLADWKIEKDGDSGIYLRGSPQVQIWDPTTWPEGSGGLYNNEKGPRKPLLRADNPVGTWNTFRIRMVGDRVTVFLNDVLVVDSVALENYWDRSIPIFARGQIELQSHNTPLYFKNIFIREIPRQKQLFAGKLFNGIDLTGWQAVEGKQEGWGVDGDVLYTTGSGGGWLSTTREFEDFRMDLDFRVPEGGNSGVFIRAPRQGDPAYTGIEIQVLDDYAAQYASLKPWQYCGSLYGVQPPSMRASKKANEWQHMQITADGPHITVVLNDQQIVDANLVSHMDKEALHPGLKRRSGFIGLQCHGMKVEYRNIILNELR